MNNYFEEFGLNIEGLQKIELPKFIDGKVDGIISERFISYIIGTQAKKSFARLIVEKDKELKYHAETISFEKDPEAVKEALSKYQKEKNEFDRMINAWKEENKDMFEKVPYVPDVSIYARGFQLPKNIQFTVEEAVQGYKLSNALSNHIKKNKESVQTSFKIMIKPEFKEEYDIIRNCYSTSIGLPSEKEIKDTVVKEIKVVKTRLKLNRKPYEDANPFYKYAEGYVDYLINLDPDSLKSDYNSESEEEY